MPLATAKAVMTQVPWLVETPRLPEMVGSETLAMVESSTCMKVPAASASAVIASLPPSMARGWPGALIAFSLLRFSLRRTRSAGAAVVAHDLGDQGIHRCLVAV